ncbi:muscular LMNA-interacting protein [Rhinophrynus dorsalis]
MISSIGSGTNPQAFTFVPTSGKLPIQVLVGKDSYSCIKVVSCRKEEMARKPEEVSETLSEKSMFSRDESLLGSYNKSGTEQTFSAQKVSSRNAEESENTQQNDIFIAECVLIIDSDESEDEMNKGTQMSSFEEGYQRSEAPIAAAQQPKATLLNFHVDEIYVPEPQQNQLPHNEYYEEKEPQLCSTVPTAGSVKFRPHLTEIYSNNLCLHQKPSLMSLTYCVPENIFEEHTMEQSSPTFNKLLQTAATVSSVNTQQTSSHARNNKLEKFSHFPSNSEIQKSFASGVPTSTCERVHTLSPLPIQIIKYPLCASPSPLQSPIYGSSSTICSISESCNPCSKDGSPVPSRLSFLTSLLKSKKLGHKRPFSPEFNQPPQPNPSFQKSKLPSNISRKSLSCFSLDNPKEIKCTYFQRQDEMFPSVSESNILNAEDRFHQKPIRSLSPDSRQFKTSLGLLNSKTAEPSFSQLQQSSINPTSSSKENILPLNVKPPLNKENYKPSKKYSLLGKSRKVTLFPPILPINQSQSLSHLTNQRQKMLPNPNKYIFHGDHFIPSIYTPRDYSGARHVENMQADPSSSINMTKKHISHPKSHTSQIFLNESNHSKLDISTSLHPNYRSHSNSVSLVELPRTNESKSISTDNIQSPPRPALSRSRELLSTYSLSQYLDHENKKSYKIKSDYKKFAAIPTNTLLLDQKAIDEPELNVANPALDETMETHSEVYSPALLRQQTEEICAVIDEVLHEQLPLNSNSVSRASKTKLDSKTINIPKSLSRSAGRETKYASLQPPKAALKDCQPEVGTIINELVGIG